MSFLRFVGSRRHADSGVESGLFEIVAGIEKNPVTRQADEEAIRANLDWFNEHLPVPHRFNRTSSKGYYRRNAKGISWFKDTAAEYLARMYELKRIAEDYGFHITVIREDRIGYIVYEDEFQAVAEPFSDTHTG